MRSSSPLSVIIPTLDAAAILPAAFGALGEADRSGLLREIVVADGGSGDDTVAIAIAAGAHVLHAPRGRGAQLAAGAVAASGPWLCFLHADTRPAPGWAEAVAGFIADPANRECAAYFAYRLDDEAKAARRLERIVSWRSRRLGLPYGDQGLILSAEFYRDLGGFPVLPLMEDVALARRIGRRRLVALGIGAVTSAERYRRDGYVARVLRNSGCLALYYLGVPSRVILRLYR